MKFYKVIEQHYGDRMYKVGDIRQLNEADANTLKKMRLIADIEPETVEQPENVDNVAETVEPETVDNVAETNAKTQAEAENTETETTGQPEKKSHKKAQNADAGTN